MENTHRAIYSAASAQQAHILANALQERGIFAYVTNDALAGASGDLPFGVLTAPQVVVHVDDAEEARRLALEFEGSSHASMQPRPARWQFSFATMLYAVTWIAVFLAIHRAIRNGAARAIANWAAFSAMALVTFVIVAWRMAQRNRSYPSELLPGQWAEPPVAEDELEDEETDDGDGDAEWPVCPHCRRPRMTSCPICETSGSDFAPAFVPRLAAEADDEPQDESSESRPLAVLCPTCDEPFAPRFPAQCEWCGHRFRDGYPVLKTASEVTSPFEDMNPRVWLVLGGLVLLLLGVGAFFAEFVLKR